VSPQLLYFASFTEASFTLHTKVRHHISRNTDSIVK